MNTYYRKMKKNNKQLNNKKYMIPKLIHYCWFGRGPMPKVVLWCIDSWKKKCPDYTIKLWNEDNFDVNSVPFTKQAYDAKKWAFVADYVRIYALYHEGGICIDADEYVLKSFDDLLDNRLVSCHEYYPGIFEPYFKELNPADWLPYGDEKWINRAGLSLCANPLMGERHHPFFKDCLDYYNSIDFNYDANSEPYKLQIVGNLITKIAINYGYCYNIKIQTLKDGIVVLGPETFILNSLFYDRKKSYVIHMALGSWKNDVNQVAWRMRLLKSHPSVSLMILKLTCFLRRIKYLFISQHEINRRMGNFWNDVDFTV